MNMLEHVIKETLHHCWIEGDGVPEDMLESVLGEIWSRHGTVDFEEMDFTWASSLIKETVQQQPYIGEHGVYKIPNNVGTLIDFDYDQLLKFYTKNFYINLGYADALCRVLEDAHYGVPVTVDDALYLHRCLFSPLTVAITGVTRRYNPGVLRGGGCETQIRPFVGSVRNPSDWKDVKDNMKIWEEEVAHLWDSDMPFLGFLARVHSEFEIIHPFADGNGRTGRLLNNLCAVRMCEPLMVVTSGEWQMQYYEGLRHATNYDYNILEQVLHYARCEAVVK